MNTDRELLELAAKAAGLHRCENYYTDAAGNHVEWSPLTDDGDALRLAMALGLVVDCSRPSAGAPYTQHAFWLDDTMSTAELTRRAIVRAAAEIGRQMP